MLKNKKINIAFILFLFLLILSCKSRGEDAFDRGMQFLQERDFNSAKLAFLEAKSFFKEQGTREKEIQALIYIELTALEEGYFNNSITNLKKIELELTKEELANPDIYCLLKLAQARAFTYGFLSELALSVLEELKAFIDKYCKQKEETECRKLSSFMEKYLIYESITSCMSGFSQNLPDVELFDIDENIRTILKNLSTGDRKSLEEAYSLALNYQPGNIDLVWLVHLKAVYSTVLSVTDKIRLMDAAEDYFKEKKSFCLSGYASYFSAEIRNKGLPLKEYEDLNLIVEKYLYALDILDAVGKEDFYINALTGTAIILYNMGRYFNARDYFLKALDFYIKKNDENNTAETYNYLATIDKALGNLTVSENEYLKALELFQKAGDKNKIASIYNNLGIIYTKQLDFDSALASYDYAISMIDSMMGETEAEETINQLIYSKLIKINNKAEILILKEKYSAALDTYLLPALITMYSHNLEETELDADVKLNIAKCKYHQIMAMDYIDLNSFNEILLLLIEAQEIYESLNLYEKQREVEYFQALIYFNSGEYKEAEKIYQKVKRFFEESNNIYNLAQVSYSLYLTSKELGKDEEALDNLLVCVDNYDDYINLIPSVGNQTVLFEKYLPYFQKLLDELILAGKYELAFNYSEKMKARILIQQMKLKEIDPLLNIPEEYKKRLIELNVIESNLIKEFERAYYMSFFYSNYDYLNKLQGAINDLKNERQGIFKEIRVINAHIADINEVYSVTASQVQEALTDDQIMVSYVFSENNLYAFLITNESIEVKELKEFKREKLKDDITSFRFALQNYYFSPDVEARSLYTLLIKPLKSDFLSYGHLMIIPSEELFYIPFYALKNPDTDKYLIDEYSGIITYNISATIYLQLLNSEKRKYDLEYIGIGNPDYRGRFSQLVFTLQELEETQKLFGAEGVIYTGSNATETLVKDADISRYRYVHFSCHGMNYGESDTLFLSFPALLLAVQTGDLNDGYLRYDEISTLDCPAEMVLLSACQTGLGEIVVGDGLVGLNQAFHIAGSKAIIASLWSVSDKYTMLLVVDFFRQLKSGVPVALALKTAMLNTREQEMAEYGLEHPFLWAAFVITGRVEG